ncbi:hypothetical protein ALC56_05462 [Trachymyrmex septentrionalis]|uniref:Uncharacterized protein n=1 Tax=Trachymyrmex septentrionalis TaxID=34720 RepID=A0A195FJT1_9HYME|nr:hypothetical protein ALC56_05462 [Trachymyrmex septentrionalis]
MPPTTPTDPAMCSLCPRSKKAHHPKKLVRFDSIVDTFSISDSNAATNERVSATIFYFVLFSRSKWLVAILLCFNDATKSATKHMNIFFMNYIKKSVKVNFRTRHIFCQ